MTPDPSVGACCPFRSPKGFSLLAEVGTDDLLFIQHDRGSAFRSRAAVVEDVDAVCLVSHHLHVVFDSDHLDPQLLLDLQDQIGEILSFVARDPC